MRAPSLIRRFFGIPWLWAVLAQGAFGSPEFTKPIKGYPKEVRAIEYAVPEDKSEQPALYWSPEMDDAGPFPLLIALHTWSGDYRQAGGESKYAEWCIENSWVFMHPHFRGPNKSAEAMGSDLMVADIRAAVEWAKGNSSIDENRIYAVGVSGGGHASQLVAGRLPKIWAGVSAWCGISDIAAWYRETRAAGQKKYARHIELALGGVPEAGSKFEKSALHRSPITWLEHAGAVPLDINHGIHDGRKGSVPFTHSLHAWNAVVSEAEQIPDEFITSFYQSRDPEEEVTTDPLYGKRSIRFRRTHENTRLTIFDGGHEMIHVAALNWLAAQRKGRPTVWNPARVAELEVGEGDSQSGK